MKRHPTVEEIKSAMWCLGSQSEVKNFQNMKMKVSSQAKPGLGESEFGFRFKK
jgi:hypothetical protein